MLNKADDAALVAPPLANGLAPMSTNMMSPIGEEAKDAGGFIYSGGIGNFKVDPSAVMKSQFEHELTEMKKAMAKMTIAVTNSEKKADKALTASGKK